MTNTKIGRIGRSIFTVIKDFTLLRIEKSTQNINIYTTPLYYFCYNILRDHCVNLSNSIRKTNIQH